MGAAASLRVVVNRTEHRLSPSASAVIGREPGSEIVVPAGSVSRRHARLYFSQDGWMLEDLGSTNGTYVGGRRVTSILLAHATSVELGSPGAQVQLWVEPVPAGDTATSSTSIPVTTGVAGLVLGGMLLVCVGMFVLDWYRINVTSDGPFRTSGGVRLELDAEGLAVAAGAIGGLLGLLGLRANASRGVIAAVLIVTALATAGTALYLMFGPKGDDQLAAVPGLTVRADVSLDVGGYVTVGGACLLAIGGILEASRRAPTMSR